ncbi:MAG: ArsR/SmtB family transcription factor [Haloarculaceae archaeon]
MEKALWYLLAGTRGGENRARIIRLLDGRPRNANQLAEEMDVDYNTVRHHLDMLTDHDVVETGGDDYGKLYFLTDRFERHREEFERIVARVEPTGDGDGTASDADADAEG